MLGWEENGGKARTRKVCVICGPETSRYRRREIFTGNIGVQNEDRENLEMH